MILFSRTRMAVLAAGLAFTPVAAAFAGMPCDALLSRARMLAAQHPEVTEDGRFLGAILGDQPEDSGRNIDCDGLRTWLDNAGYDARIVDDLERDDAVCFTALWLSDHREDGGFVALSGTQGSGHAPVAQILDLEGSRLRVGWGWIGMGAPEHFDVVHVGGRAYPAMFTPKLNGTDLSYRMDLISVETDSPLCGISITYQPQFIGRWFGPRGENDVDPEVRRAVDPIISALAGGRDVQSLVKPWLDRSRGGSPYDLAISGYPERPIDGMRYPNTGDHVYPLPSGPPFLGGEYDDTYYASAYGSVSQDAAIPLILGGRRLLLTFGYAGTPGTPPPDAGFGLWEYNDQRREFDGVAGGIIERHGINPRIE